MKMLKQDDGNVPKHDEINGNRKVNILKTIMF